MEMGVRLWRCVKTEGVGNVGSVGKRLGGHVGVGGCTLCGGGVGVVHRSSSK